MLKIYLFAVLLILSVTARAVDIGPLHWEAPPDTKPYAEIELTDKGAIDLSTLRLSIATPEAYAVAGLNYHPELATVQLSSRNVAEGRILFRLDKFPQNTSSLDLLILVNNQMTLSLAEYHIDRLQTSHKVSPARAGSRLAAQSRNISNNKNEKIIAKANNSAPSALADARKAIDVWVSAWSQRDVDGYLAAYAANYTGEQAKVTREDWIKLRRQRILAHQTIAVELSDIELVRNGKAVVATFTQNFRSNNLQDQARKRLTLELTDGRWLIRREEVLR